MATCDPCEHGRVQDLPPMGGYPPIKYKRILPKRVFSGPILFAGYLSMTAGSIFLYYLSDRKIRKHTIELRSTRMAIYPFLVAERDREYLRQIRMNREEEESLMADVEGWEVGTYYGERIYQMLPEDTFVNPIFHEYWAHCNPREWFRRCYTKLRS